MTSYTRTMDFLHKKLLQATTKVQEDKIVDWMLAEARLKQAAEKNSQKSTSDINKSNNKVYKLTITETQQLLNVAC